LICLLTLSRNLASNAQDVFSYPTKHQQQECDQAFYLCRRGSYYLFERRDCSCRGVLRGGYSGCRIAGSEVEKPSRMTRQDSSRSLRQVRNGSASRHESRRLSCLEYARRRVQNLPQRAHLAHDVPKACSQPSSTPVCESRSIVAQSVQKPRPTRETPMAYLGRRIEDLGI
jgi:hypothetical protein